MTRFYSGRHWLSSTSTSGGIAAPLPDAQIGSPHTPLQGFQPLVCYGQKTFTFHLDFGSEIVQNARYGMLALHSMENLELANPIPGRVKGNKSRMISANKAPFGVLAPSYNKRFKKWYIDRGMNFRPVYQSYTSQNNSLVRCRVEEMDWKVWIKGKSNRAQFAARFLA